MGGTYSPVPEPRTYGFAMIAAAFASMVWWRWRTVTLLADSLKPSS